MLTPGIIHNKLKIKAAINNAKCFLKVQEECGSFNNYLWGLVGNRVQINSFNKLEEIPSETETSRHMSRQLIRIGFQFVGPKICYAFMQATGLVNDHLQKCFRYETLRCQR